MMRVVADTNIFISALMFGGLPSSFLDLAFLRFFQLVTSPNLLDELDQKLRLKFALSADDADRIRTKLESVALVIKPDRQTPGDGSGTLIAFLASWVRERRRARGPCTPGGAKRILTRSRNARGAVIRGAGMLASVRGILRVVLK